MWEVNIWQRQYVPYISFSFFPFVFKTREWGNQFFSVILHQHIAILPLPKIISSLWFFNCCCTQVYCEKERIKWSNLLSYSDFCSFLHSLWDQHFMRKGIILMMGRKASAKKQMTKIPCYDFLLYFMCDDSAGFPSFSMGLRNWHDTVPLIQILSPCSFFGQHN